MRNLKITLMMVASLVLTLFLGLAGCGDDHRHRMDMHDDRDHSTVIIDRSGNDRHEDRDRR